MRFGKPYRRKYNRILSGLLVLCVLLLPACAPTAPQSGAEPSLLLADEAYALRAAVLYDGAQQGSGWQATLGYLRQSTLIGLEAEALDVGENPALDGYDILYLDASLAGAAGIDGLTQQITNYTAAGGTVVLDNSLYTVFDKSFIGARDFVPMGACPIAPDFPKLGEDLGELQEILADFTTLYAAYADYPDLQTRDYGVTVVCDNAVALAKWEGSALYTINRYEKGLVFFTNPLLPNFFSLSGFDLEPLDETQLAFANTTAGCNQLLVNAFAGYVAKQRYGYYLGRVFGSFGSPGMAWELHYEEITGIANNSMEIFSKLCEEYLQIPSFTLIRSSYRWFQRSETVTYYLNEDQRGGLRYALDFDESAYSSGTHIESGGAWLALDGVHDAGSYFVDYPEYTQRAYPALCDYNGDGLADLFCGSADGKLYYYEGTAFDERLHVSVPQMLTDDGEEPLSVGGFSAPQLIDLDGDGYLDLISGAADGKLYWFAGEGSLRFTPRGVLLDTDLRGQVLPAVGDLNHDGVPDLAVGSNAGVLLLFYGSAEDKGVSFSRRDMDSLSRSCANAGLGSFLAPAIADRDGDGRQELAVGTFDGYIALFDEDAAGEPGFSGFLTIEEMNYKGNNNLKTGNNCVPVFYDLDGDGAQDLVCGSLEYGLAYPIDSPYFPCADELREQVAYARAHDYYLGVHFYTNAYASTEREAYELERHREALLAYGAEPSGLGANQHTWYTSRLHPAQTQRSLWEAGLLWNSGFAPAGSGFNAPQSAAENVVSLPFFLMDGQERTILLQNCSVLPYCGTEWTEISAKYGVPICVYYHCDFVYNSDAEARSYLQQLSDFRQRHQYNFVSEDQLMAAIAAAYNLTVRAESTLTDGALTLTLTPGEESGDFALYDADYQRSAGVKLVFREDLSPADIEVNADVWRVDGQSLYLGLNRSVTLREGGASAKTHLARVNVAAELSSETDGVSIRFLDGGMLQAVVDGRASTPSAGWTLTELDGQTMFTKYGGAETLRLVWELE